MDGGQPTIDQGDIVQDAAISVRGVGKFFPHLTSQYLRQAPLRIARNLRARGRAMLSPAARRAKPKPPAPRAGIWALRDISFDVSHGEVLGVIGRNGSGKTTLLKVLSRVLAPNEGKAMLNGRVAAMLGVGTGFHPLFTGRENIYMSGLLLGLTRGEIDRRFDAIVDFAEVGDFIDEPVKIYSTGMRARLGYSVAVEMEPEILLLDEILAVGDMGFQRKCLLRMQEGRKRGRTILLVSHNMNAIKGYCNRVILIEQGRLVKQGDPADVVSYYLSNMFELGKKSSLADRTDREGSGAIRIDGYWFEDALGRTVGHAVSGEECTLCMSFICPQGQVEGPVSASVVITDANGRWITRLSTHLTHSDFAAFGARGTIHCHVPALMLIPGEYGFSFRISSNDRLADHIENAARFSVAPGDFYGTGQNERHSPLLVDFSWDVIEREPTGQRAVRTDFSDRTKEMEAAAASLEMPAAAAKS